MFDQIFKEHAAPQLADVFGVQARYRHPSDSDSESVDLEYVMISDVRRERREREFGAEIFEVRYFQLITDPENSRYCGTEKLAIHGRMLVGNGEDCQEWPIEEQPAVDSDGFTNVKCSRYLRHEIGNRTVRG